MYNDAPVAQSVRYDVARKNLKVADFPQEDGEVLQSNGIEVPDIEDAFPDEIVLQVPIEFDGMDADNQNDKPLIVGFQGQALNNEEGGYAHHEAKVGSTATDEQNRLQYYKSPTYQKDLVINDQRENLHETNIPSTDILSKEKTKDGF